MRYCVTALFLLVALINLLPVSGVFSDQQLVRLYSIDSNALSPELSLLLRHRALLFAIVGALLVYAAFYPAVRGVATLAALFSMLSYCFLVFHLRIDHPALLRIAWVDVAATVLLLLAYALSFRQV